MFLLNSCIEAVNNPFNSSEYIILDNGEYGDNIASIGRFVSTPIGLWSMSITFDTTPFKAVLPTVNLSPIEKFCSTSIKYSISDIISHKT